MLYLPQVCALLSNPGLAVDRTTLVWMRVLRVYAFHQYLIVSLKSHEIDPNCSGFRDSSSFRGPDFRQLISPTVDLLVLPFPESVTLLNSVLVSASCLLV
jgi:hypothetical protein